MPDRMVWTAPNGTAIDLTDRSAGYIQPEGAQGLRAPSFSLTSRRLAGIDGVTVEAVSADPREMSVPLMIEASTKQLFRAKARALVHAMSPRMGAGVLTVTTEFGDSRSVSCYCTGGLEGDESLRSAGSGLWWRMVLKFQAPSPWWEGTPVSVSFGLAAPSVFLSSSLPFPRMLSASTIQGAQTIDLTTSDAPSYPMWTITGPGSSLTLTNVTTGRVIQVNAALGDGQTMVIDTRPGMQSVRAGDGTNLMSTLSSDPALWPLIEGVNQVSAVLGNAGAASRISAVYSPRYAGI